MSGSRSGRIGHVHKGGERDHKPTRVRTVLNEKQLHTLRTCYAANPRPDALMKVGVSTIGTPRQQFKSRKIRIKKNTNTLSRVIFKVTYQSKLWRIQHWTGQSGRRDTASAESIRSLYIRMCGEGARFRPKSLSCQKYNKFCTNGIRIEVKTFPGGGRILAS